MSEELKGNWRSIVGGYQFLSSLDLEDGQEITVEIEKVTMELANDPTTKKPKKLLSLKLKGTDRLLALNKTNAKRITEIAKSADVSKWKGLKITIHRIPITAFGKAQHALRIK